MGALQINCYLSESQIASILKEVECKLYAATPKDIDDFDDEIHGVCVLIDYSKFLDDVSIETSEILNSDWEILYEDTAVFTSRLKGIIDDYNQLNKESYRQSLEIRNDQLKEIYCYEKGR